MSNKTICIIGAMDSEVSKLKSDLENIEEIKQGVLTFYKGSISGRDVVLVKSGVGKTAAAVCTQIAADKFNPRFIINTGIAGGLAPGQDTGDIVIADKLVYHDFDVTAIGYARGYICSGGKSDEPTYFYTDKKLLEIFVKVLKEKMPQVKYHIGTAVSGDMFIGSSGKKQELREVFNACAADMEGAAIAHAAELNQIPFITIRTLSDLADEKAGAGHKFMEMEAANTSAAAIEYFIKEI